MLNGSVEARHRLAPPTSQWTGTGLLAPTEFCCCNRVCRTGAPRSSPWTPVGARRRLVPTSTRHPAHRPFPRCLPRNATIRRIPPPSSRRSDAAPRPIFCCDRRFRIGAWYCSLMAERRLLHSDQQRTESSNINHHFPRNPDHTLAVHSVASDICGSPSQNRPATTLAVRECLRR